MKLIDILVEENIENGWSWPEHANCITQDSDREIIPATCQPCVAKFDASFNRWFLNGSRIGGFIADILASDYETAIITRGQYEAALAAKNEGWIEWGGGECQVEEGTLVDVKYRCGDVNLHIKAGEPDSAGSIDTAFAVRWSKLGAEYDIIAYRLHQPKEAGQTEVEQEIDMNECIGQDAAQVWGGEGKPAIGEKCEHHSGGQWEAVTIAGIYENLVTGFTDYWMVKEDGSSYTVGNPYRFRPIRSEADRKRDEAVQALCDAGGGNGKVDEKAGYGSCWFDVYDAIAAGKIPGVKLED